MDVSIHSLFARFNCAQRWACLFWRNSGIINDFRAPQTVSGHCGRDHSIFRGSNPHLGYKTEQEFPKVSLFQAQTKYNFRVSLESFFVLNRERDLSAIFKPKFCLLNHDPGYLGLQGGYVLTDVKFYPFMTSASVCLSSQKGRPDSNLCMRLGEEVHHGGCTTIASLHVRIFSQCK